MAKSDDWRKASADLCSSITESSSSASQTFGCLLQELNAFIYPVDGLPEADVHQFLCAVTLTSSVYSPRTVPQLAQLCYSIYSTLKSSPPQHVDDQLFHFFTGWLSDAEPATELLYLLALVKPSHHSHKAVCLRVAASAVEPSLQLDVRRAALHYLTILCDSKCEASSEELAQPLEALSRQLLEAAQNRTDSAAVTKLIISQLRAIGRLVKLASEGFLQPLLPSLLAGIRYYMCTGLPGKTGPVVPLPPAAIPTAVKPKKDRRCVTTAGPHSSSRSSRQLQSRPPRPPSAPTTSESEVSDNEQVDTVTKALSGKLRHQTLTCLASVFAVIGPHKTFSFWLSFLPDGPRTAHSPPSLLSCALRDPSHKCRSAALAVLYTMLEGSRPYLAAADDHSHSAGLAFTPFSFKLGGVLREIHHCLILSLGIEAQPVVLTRTVRCLAILASNTPYHQLSSGYTSRILSTLQPLSQHRDIDVRVACLTCCGAVLATSPALAEVAAWLKETPAPWLLTWCSSILQPADTASAALQTEALQVLAAATKFYFPSLLGNWGMVVELCVCHLSTAQQQHSLKLLEELTRASAELPEAGQLWPLLLNGPLTDILQSPSSPVQCAQACSVLATLSDTAIQQLQPSLRILALTLALGLSRDDSAPATVSSSAVRALGVLCTFPNLKEDKAFLQDCEAAILHALASPSQLMRVQASWALANLTAVLAASKSHGRQDSYTLLLSAAKKGLRDKDVIKCNAVRALGNILKNISPFAEEEVHSLCFQLVQCMSSGTMKLRWNTCYACHSIFSSTSFSETHSKATDVLLKALCETVCTCPNFKVCTNASLALGSLSLYTPTHLRLIWPAMLTSLEHSLQHEDFLEFQQATNFRTQLCRSMCHVLCVLTDLTLIPPHSLCEPALVCLKECLNTISKEEKCRTELETVERKLESSPAIVQANSVLTAIFTVLHRTLGL